MSGARNITILKRVPKPWDRATHRCCICRRPIDPRVVHQIMEQVWAHESCYARMAAAGRLIFLEKPIRTYRPTG